jgi:AAA domain
MSIPELDDAFRMAEEIYGTNGSKPNGHAARLDVVCLADVKPRPIEWLWNFWIAIGKVSVLAGDGGQGKSTILCDLAARTSTGDLWPDGAERGEPGGVLILAAEDDVEDTLAPRLIAAGADMQRVFNIRSVMTGDDQGRRSFNLQADLAALEMEIRRRENIRLVIIDPVTSYLGKVDSHKNAEVRTVLEPLGEMAARLRVAVICNNHFSKGGGNANSRIIGSVAFVNQARAAFIVTPDAENEGRLLLMPAKVNNTPLRHGLAYRIGGIMIHDDDGGEILTSQILWESEPVKMTADEALAAHSVNDEAKSAKDEAIEFLSDILSQGEMPIEDVRKAATNAGITPKSLRSAREALEVKSKRDGFGPGAVFSYSLPGGPSVPPRSSILAHDPHTCPRSEEGKYEQARASMEAAPPPIAPEPAPADDPWYLPPELDRRRERLGPPAISAGSDDDLGDI